MNRGEMRAFLEALLGDTLSESKLWTPTLKNELITAACQATADWLPPELLEVLWKTVTQNIVSTQAEYGIEGAGFSLTDYTRWVRIRAILATAVTTMQEAQVVPQDRLLSTNFLYQPTFYQPMVAIIPRTLDATGKNRAISIRPIPTASITGGLEMIFLRSLPVMTLDADVSVLPNEFHRVAMNHAASYAWSKAKKADLAALNWMLWRTRMVTENAKFGRAVEPPKEVS